MSDRQSVNTQSESSIREEIAKSLLEARERTLLLLEPLSDEDLRKQHDPLMSPIIWDIGHIAHFEELWLTRNLDGEIKFSEMPGIYNPFENPRSKRGALPLQSRTVIYGELERIREKVLDRLSAVEFDPSNPLLRDGYVYNLVLQHEYQHCETILQTLQLKQGTPYPAPRSHAFPISPDGGEPEMVNFPGGTVSVGTDDRAKSYDNERPLHEVVVAPFNIDRTPVTNGSYREFMNDGGYTRRELWSGDGYDWARGSGISAPKYWEMRGTEWFQQTMDIVRPVDPSRPVCHVSFHEAAAFARWAGKRLPTETEWETAAGWNQNRKAAQRYPWGESTVTTMNANIDQLSFDTAPVGTFRDYASPMGCTGMIGDIWEWTSSDFAGYPGFSAFPYPEYSKIFFGPDYKVLRGGSWATRPGAIRNTFRNWDYPIRRQIFSGFRCASDA